MPKVGSVPVVWTELEAQLVAEFLSFTNAWSYGTSLVVG